MTTNQSPAGGDVEAREAALAAARDKWRRNSYDVPTIVNAAIDAYLAKLKPESSRIAEIRERAREDDAELQIPTPSPPDMDFKRWVVAAADRETLLSHITAIEAELANERDRANTLATLMNKGTQDLLGLMNEKSDIEADRDRMREALEEIKSWKNDKLGSRSPDIERGAVNEAFDRGCGMAFFRCAARANAALNSSKPGEG